MASARRAGGAGGVTRIALVVAVAENGVIGAGGALPWRIADDLAFFKRVTLGKPVIMGRKTCQSIGKPLPGRLNIVVTRDRNYAPQGVETAPSLGAALARAQAAAIALGASEIAVIGGAEIYAAALPLADRIYFTRVHASPTGDTFFPHLPEAEWRATRLGMAEADDPPASATKWRNQYACSFFQLDRMGPGPVDKG